MADAGFFVREDRVFCHCAPSEQANSPRWLLHAPLCISNPHDLASEPLEERSSWSLTTPHQCNTQRQISLPPKGCSWYYFINIILQTSPSPTGSCALTSNSSCTKPGLECRNCCPRIHEEYRHQTWKHAACDLEQVVWVYGKICGGFV